MNCTEKQIKQYIIKMISRGSTFEYAKRNLLYRHHCDERIIDKIIKELSSTISPQILYKTVLEGLYSKCLRVGKGPKWFTMMAKKKGIPEELISEFLSNHSFEEARIKAEEKSKTKKDPYLFMKRQGF
jgi:SOS response regulatory protein OraA/RecX